MRIFNLILSIASITLLISSAHAKPERVLTLSLNSNKLEIASSIKVNVDDLFFKIACATKNFSKPKENKYYFSKEYQAKFNTISYQKINISTPIRTYQTYTLGEKPSLKISLESDERVKSCWVHWNIFAYNMQTEEILDINGYNLNNELKSKLNVKKGKLNFKSRPYFMQKSNFSDLILK
ncbi:hypothetical protein N9N67_07515 [Bacteriovoracaceae bacterium]|nr:hypothetical protein [Bacteriovoracaceae bacterium]